MKISRNLIISAILFVVVLIIYISTLCPTIYFGKPLEYVAQATGQSIVKPVSHPAWFFLAKLFKYITPSDPAYGLNILSAILGAWAVALLYLILANLSHDRTSEERQRFSHIPYLRQFSAVAGCLMLAFSPLYWGASVVAGPDTMKAFLMVLTGYFFVKYAFLKRKRYLLYFSIAYGVALANVPVMFFFIPVVFILMLVYCREIFEDAVAIGLSIGLFLIAFIPFVAVVPWSFAKEPPSYLLQPNVVQAFSYYQEWIYFDLKSILPVAMSPTYIAMWLLLLILPVFFPLIYLLWRKRSAAAASASISAIKYAMMLAFLGIGIAYMFGSDFYTIGYSSYIERLPPQYIVPLILVASWLTYTFGYWIVIICGRVAEGTPQGERYAAGYNKPVYSVLAVVVLLIPVVLFVLSLPDSNKRNETILRDFASDILASCEEGSVIVIPNAPDLKGSFYELGNALRYVNTYPSLGSEYAYSDVETVEKTIVDIPFAKRYAASGRIEFEIYLIYCIWQDEGSGYLYRENFADARNRPHDRIIQETIRNQNFKDVYFINNYMVFTPANQIINAMYDLVPKGLLYRAVPYSSSDYIAKDAIAENDEIWKDFAIHDYLEGRSIDPNDYYRKESKERRRFTPKANILNHYSRLANDAGLVCREQGLDEKAEEYLDSALNFNNHNYSAMVNLAKSLEDKGSSEKRVEDLKENALEFREQMTKQAQERIAMSLESEKLLEAETELRKRQDIQTTLYLIWVYGYVIDPDFYKDFVSTLYTGNTQLSGPQAAPFLALRYKMLQLALVMNPDDPDLHTANGSFLQSRPSMIDKVRAIIEFQTALDLGAEQKRAILTLIANNYMKIAAQIQASGAVEEAEPYRDAAEKFIKMSIAAPSSVEDDRLEKRYDDIQARFNLLMLYVNFKYNLEYAQGLAKKINQSVTKDMPGIFLQSTSFVFQTMMLQGKDDEIANYVDDFSKENPEMESTIKELLARLYASQDRLREAGRIYEKIKENVRDEDGRIVLTLATLYTEQKEWEKIIALDINAPAAEPVLVSNFHLRKGEAYYQLNQLTKAIDEFELAFRVYQSARETTEGTDDILILNSLSWLYYVVGWDMSETSDGRDYLKKALNYSKEVYDRTSLMTDDPQGGLGLHPRVLRTWDTYAWILYQTTEEKQEAFSIMSEAYFANPAHHQIKYHYGAMLLDKALKEDMPEKIEEALQLITEGYASGLEDFEASEAKKTLKDNGKPIPEIIKEE